MSEEYGNYKGEIEDLRKELENFQQEKERVRSIIGKIGGVPKFSGKIINTVFLLIIVVSVVISIIAGDEWRLIMIEVATATLAVKIIYLIHCQMRVSHFEFWMLSSIEWRLNEVMKLLRESKKEKKEQD